MYQLTLVSLELLYFISVSPTNPYRSMNRVNVIQGYDCSATQLFATFYDVKMLLQRLASSHFIIFNNVRYGNELLMSSVQEPNFPQKISHRSFQ